MKIFSKLILATAFVAISATAGAQVRWDPTLWTNKEAAQRVEIINNGKAVKAIPLTNDHAHIRNTRTLHLSEDEPYLIVKIAVDHEFVIAKNYSGWCFYNQFKRKDGTPLTESEIVKLNSMVFHNQYFYQTPGMQRILFDDNEMFEGSVPFDVFVIDLNEGNRYNILSNGDMDIPANPDFVDYNDDYQLQSFISFEMCCWGRNGADKNVYLGSNSKGETSLGVTYEYIATAGMYDILDTDELVDPTLVKDLIDNYKNGTSLVEVRPGEEGPGGVDNVAADNIKISGTRGGIRAKGAANIAVYSITGIEVANVNDDVLSVAPGMYIACATAADGSRSTAKVIVR